MALRVGKRRAYDITCAIDQFLNIAVFTIRRRDRMRCAPPSGRVLKEVRARVCTVIDRARIERLGKGRRIARMRRRESDR